MSTPAYQADGRAISREAFYAIACDPRQSVVVEACAGAGKTWMLVSRILRALLNGAQPQEVLAITFTRKAAGEMRERLDKLLRELASPEVTPERRVFELVTRGVPAAEAATLEPRLAGLYETVLSSGRSVEVRTFHAWFSQLLRTAPMGLLAELGLQPNMELIESIDEHRPAVMRRFHSRVLADASLHADFQAITQERGSHQLGIWLTAALNKRVELELADKAGALESSVPPAVAAGHPADEFLSAAWQSRVTTLAEKLGRGKAKATQAASALIDALQHSDALRRYEAAWRALFTKDDTPRKQLGDVDDLVAVQAELEDCKGRVHQQNCHIEHLRLVRLSRALLAEFAVYKRTRNIADMADLEGCALALLRDSSLSAWVQEKLDARIRHVLVDEFQDTSPLQWHALHSWLSAYAGAGGGHSGQQPPGVFIVGDPKQSIYRFRRAEPRVFDAARDFVVDGLAGHWLACDHTRRNAPQVLHAVNAVFSVAQQSGEYEGFRAHTTEVTAESRAAGVHALPVVPRDKTIKQKSASEEPVWRDSLTTPRHEPEHRLREAEARWVAQAIQSLVQAGDATPGEIFVLCRKRESLRLAAQALQNAQLPFAASEAFSLNEVPEVRDLVAVLDAITSPTHRLSIAQALRSPLFGVGDGDLIALAHLADAHGGDWWQALSTRELSAHPALQHARSLLPAWRDAALHLPPHDLLDRIVADSRYRERVAASVPAERRRSALDAIDALLGQSLQLDGARYATPYNFVRALKRRAIDVAAPHQPDAVQLLTVHGAKGLEAKVVFVMDAQPERKNADTATLLVDWPAESTHPTCCAFVYSENHCPRSLDALKAQELAARQREEINGLYVAMTRARERLVFSRTEPHQKTSSTTWWERVEMITRPWEPAAGEARLESAGAYAVVNQLPTCAAVAPARAEGREADSVASRLGQAVHRTLEWLGAATGELEELSEAAADDFAVPASEVARITGAIYRSAECRRFFESFAWAGNEVAIPMHDEVLRIDRLVALDECGQRTWWVLDYKVALHPEGEAAYREQMLRYRNAVSALQPGDSVRCALIGGDGRVIEITPSQ